MLRYRQNLESALREDDLFNRVSRALPSAPPGSFYLCGLYVTDSLAGLEPGGILIACRGHAARIGMDLAGKTGFVPVEPVKRDGVFHLVEPGGGRSVTLVPLAGGDITCHLERSGFTLSAMAVDVSGGDAYELFDPPGGLEDLDGKRLRVTSPESIVADPVRVLQAAELCNRYGLEPEADTEHVIVSSAESLRDAPPERVFRTLARMMGGGELKKNAMLLRRLGVLSALFPEVEAVFDVPQNYYHHLGVWEHTLEGMDNLEEMMDSPSRTFKTQGGRVAMHLRGRVEAGVDRRTFLALAAIIHDIGKASTINVMPTGRIRFQGHERESARLAVGIAKRLGLGYGGRSHLVGLVGGHMRFGHLLKEGESAESRLRAVRELGSRCPEVVLLSLADRLATRGEASTEEASERFRRTVTRALNDYFWLKDSDPLLSGYDVIVHEGLEPGPAVGSRLFQVRVAQREGTVVNRQQALEYLAPDIKGKISRRR
jgi:poly(A) polymerase